MSMIRKYHNHKLQTTPWHREEEPGIHSLDISIRAEVKSDIGSEDSLMFSGINSPVHRVLNRSQLALFNFHFGLWSSVEKVFYSTMIGK